MKPRYPLLLTLPFAALTALASDITLEAENAQLTSGVKAHSHVNASNGQFVSGLHKWEAGVEWAEIKSPKAGEVTVTCHYANGGKPARKSIEINGEPSGTIDFTETQSWTEFDGVITFKVEVNEGANSLKIWRSTGGGDEGEVRLDYIVVTLPE